MKSASSLTTGLGLFAMFFGAGNVVFPLFVGMKAGDDLGLAILGLLCTAVALPMLAVLAMVEYRGEQKAYFERAGKWGGVTLLMLCLFLLGPFLVVPRTIAVAHSAISQTIVPVSSELFGVGYCLFIILLSLNAKTMLTMMGKVFTPLMLILLGWIIITGIFTPAATPIETPALKGFFFGLKEGYFTLDAIAALVFGQFIYMQLRQQRHDLTHDDFKKHVIRAACIAGLLLSLVYIGLAYISHTQADAAMLKPDLKQALLILLSVKMLPEQFIAVAGVIIASACITTACALSKIFADYLHHFTRHYTQKITETHCLFITIMIAYAMSLIGFNALMDYFAPVIVACYPVFILLTLHTFVRNKVPSTVMPFAILACLALGIAGVVM